MRKIRGVIGTNNAIIFEKLQRGLVAQCLMWSNAVICVLPMIEFRDSSRTIIHLIEFLSMGSLCPLNTPIELWTFWRQNKPGSIPSLKPNDPIQETPKRNTRRIEVKYRKGNLRIEAPDSAKLFLEIKRDFPKSSIVLYDGAVSVAFYCLSVVIKTLEERFGNIDIDSAIPEVQFLHFLSSTHSVLLMVMRKFGARPEKEVRL